MQDKVYVHKMTLFAESLVLQEPYELREKVPIKQVTPNNAGTSVIGSAGLFCKNRKVI